MDASSRLLVQLSKFLAVAPAVVTREGELQLEFAPGSGPVYFVGFTADLPFIQAIGDALHTHPAAYPLLELVLSAVHLRLRPTIYYTLICNNHLPLLELIDAKFRIGGRKEVSGWELCSKVWDQILLQIRARGPAAPQ